MPATPVSRTPGPYARQLRPAVLAKKVNVCFCTVHPSPEICTPTDTCCGPNASKLGVATRMVVLLTNVPSASASFLPAVNLTDTEPSRKRRPEISIWVEPYTGPIAGETPVQAYGGPMTAPACRRHVSPSQRLDQPPNMDDSGAACIIHPRSVLARLWRLRRKLRPRVRHHRGRGPLLRAGVPECRRYSCSPWRPSCRQS